MASEIEAAADRFRAMIDAGRSLVAEHTPVELLGAVEASRLLYDLTNKPGTFWDGATGSGMNWRLAMSELEAERSHLRLDSEPVILYSLLFAARPGARESPSRAVLPGRGDNHFVRPFRSNGGRGLLKRYVGGSKARNATTSRGATR